jgi:hypothetical protein
MNGWLHGDQRGLSMGGTWSGVWLELGLDLSYWVLKRYHHDIAINTTLQLTRHCKSAAAAAWHGGEGLEEYKFQTGSVHRHTYVGEAIHGSERAPTYLLFQGRRCGHYKGALWEPARATQLTQSTRLKQFVAVKVLSGILVTSLSLSSLPRPYRSRCRGAGQFG